jgi:hypothetical protein
MNKSLLIFLKKVFNQWSTVGSLRTIGRMV